MASIANVRSRRLWRVRRAGDDQRPRARRHVFRVDEAPGDAVVVAIEVGIPETAVECGRDVQASAVEQLVRGPGIARAEDVGRIVVETARAGTGVLVLGVADVAVRSDELHPAIL